MYLRGHYREYWGLIHRPIISVRLFYEDSVNIFVNKNIGKGSYQSITSKNNFVSIGIIAGVSN